MAKHNPAKKARQDKRQGKSASTQASEFVRDEIERIREGEHGARNTKQAIAIGLSRARRAGVKLRPPKRGKASERTVEQAERDLGKGESKGKKKPNPKRSKATLKALKREPRSTASHAALSKQAKQAARKRSPQERSAAAKKAARTRKARKATA